MDSKLKNFENNMYYLNSGKRLYLLFGAIFFLVYFFVDPTVDNFLSQSIRSFIVLFVLSIVIWGIYLYLQGKLNVELMVFLLMIIGIAVRIAYTSNTPWNERQHDVVSGHLDYIVQIAKNFSLPDSNWNQYSHPPLHHLIGAIFYRASALIHMSEDRIFEGLQLLTAFYSSCVMIIAYRTFKALKLSDVFVLVPTAIICLHPTFFILGGSINNDMLMVLFSFSVILWLIRWYENANLYNIFFLALCLGLAMMCKVSAAMLAFVIAPVFLLKLFSYKKPFKERKLFINFLIFGAISIPLGMWHPIRNLIKFDQQLGYVMRMALDHPLFCGDRSIIERFLSISWSQFISYLYPKPQIDYNIWVYILKCSVFGEYSYNAGLTSFARILLLFNIILVLVSMAAIFYVMRVDKRPERKIGKIILFLLWITQLASFIYFNIQYPFGCSMDFRYIVPTLLCGAGFIGMALEYIVAEKQALWKYIKVPISVCVGGFCLFSTLLYLFI